VASGFVKHGLDLNMDLKTKYCYFSYSIELKKAKY